MFYSTRVCCRVVPFCSFASVRTYADVASTQGDAVNNSKVRTHFWSEDKTNFMLNEMKDLNILHLLKWPKWESPNVWNRYNAARRIPQMSFLFVKILLYTIQCSCVKASAHRNNAKNDSYIAYFP